MLDALLLQLVTESCGPTPEDAYWRWRPVGGSSGGGRDLWNPATWALQDFERVRCESRRLYSHCEYAIGGAVTRRNYIVEGGFRYEVVPRQNGESVDAGLLAAANDFVSAFCEMNGLAAVEGETQFRADRDGEAFLRLFADDIPAVRFVEPERVGDPPADAAKDGRDHRLGVITAAGDTQAVEGYWVSPAPGEDAEPVEEAEVVHVKVNTDSSCRRGLPTYYPVFENLRRAEDTLASMGSMAKARAKVAIIEYAKNLTSEKAEAIKGRLTQGYQPQPDGTSKPVTVEELPFGAYLRRPEGSRLEFPSVNVGASDLVNVLQADLRAVGVVLNMPEWMFTGLADQKYSNAFVVEAPTLKAFKSIQGHLTQKFGSGRYRQQASLVWRAVKLAAERGLIPLAALPSLKIKVTPPSLEVRDKQAEAQVNSTYLTAKVKSVRKVQEELGYDPDEMDRQIKEEGAQPPPGETGAGDGANPLAGLLGGAPAAESLGLVEVDGGWIEVGEAWVWEAGFTGTVFAKNGSTYHYADGVRVPGPPRPASGRVRRHPDATPPPPSPPTPPPPLGANPKPRSRMPVAVPPHQMGEVETQLRRVYGGANHSDNAAKMTASLGMPDAALGRVTLAGRFEKKFRDDSPKSGATGVRVEVSHPDLGRVSRFVGVDKHGKKFIRNEILEVKNKNSGVGVDIFAKQVEAASADGVGYIETHAVGRFGGDFNGYYTWPQFGYNRPVGSGREWGPVKKAFPDAKSIQDVMDSPKADVPASEVQRVSDALNAFDARQAAAKSKPPPAAKTRTSITGAEWWKVNGFELKNLKFDLDSRSRSMAKLRAYLAAKKGASPTPSPPTTT